jgi:hypothetical protein
MNELFDTFSRPDTIKSLFRSSLIIYIVILATQRFQVYKTGYLLNLIFPLTILVLFVLKESKIFNIELFNFNSLFVTLFSALLIVTIKYLIDKKN